jgi:hypothetical protein
VTLTSAVPIRSAVETDLIERETGPAAVGEDGRSLGFDLGPFEIKTFRLVLDRLR